MAKPSKRIMLVDDERASHVYHQEIIEEAKLDLSGVEAYLTVDSAINRLKQLLELELMDDLPEFILVDLDMPKKDGWDFLREFSELDFKKAEPKIYIVTNSDSLDDFRKSQQFDSVVGFKNKFLSIDFFESLIS